MPISRRQVLRAGVALASESFWGPWVRRAFGQASIAHPVTTAAAPIQMVDGASAAGLNFVLRNSAAGSKYQVETLPGGLGVIDFDSDGWPDLFCTNGAALPSLTKTGPEYWNRLYRNNRDGTFIDVTEKAGLQGQGYGMGAAVGDYNNDGHEDLFVAGVHGNFLYRNNGDGTFTDVTGPAGLAGPGSPGKPAVVGRRVLDRLRQRWPARSLHFQLLRLGAGHRSRSAAASQAKRAPTAIRIIIARSRCSSTTTTAMAPSLKLRISRACPMCWARAWVLPSPTLLADGRPGIFIANDNARNLLLRNQRQGFRGDRHGRGRSLQRRRPQHLRHGRRLRRYRRRRPARHRDDRAEERNL